MDKVKYYSSNTDDFVGQNIKKIEIDENYKYIHENIFWKISSFICYRIIMMPIAFIYAKVVHGLTFKNKKVLKKAKDTGYFIFGNHTQEVIDTFIPTLGNFPRKCQIVAHPDNVALPILGTFNKMMGGFPIPSNIKAMKNFLSAMEKYLEDKNVISIYPEAHVWPYYTKIRNFPATSFKYVVNLNKPCFSFTTTYKDRGIFRPKIVVYIDGPFYPNKDLNTKKAQEGLRDKIYETMCKRCQSTNVEYIKYIKREENGADVND